MNRNHPNRLAPAVLLGRHLLAKERVPAELGKGRMQHFHWPPQRLAPEPGALPTTALAKHSSISGRCKCLGSPALPAVPTNDKRLLSNFATALASILGRRSSP